MVKREPPSLRLVDSLGNPTSKPTLVAFRNLEKERKIKYPPEFVDFVRKHGAGELNGFVRIYAPGNPQLDLTTFEDRIEIPNAIVDRVAPFGDSVAGDIYLFGTTDANYGKVFELKRLETIAAIVSDNFEEFVQRVCLGKAFGIPKDFSFQPFGTAPNKAVLNNLLRKRLSDALLRRQETRSRNSKSKKKT